MKYELPKNDKRDILDDSSVRETINIMEQLLGKKLNLNITEQGELLDMFNNPEKFIDDKETAEEIRNLRKLVLEMGGIYHG